MVSLPLLERDDALRRLGEAVAALHQGGRCVLVSGEPGIGKSRLLQAARRAHEAGVDWWAGVCEPLLAPLPLAPLLDVQPHLPPRLNRALGQGTPRVLQELLAHARGAGRPLVIAIDDLQWADDATLDLLRLLARRLDGLPVLLILAWRDTDLAPDHPVLRLLGGLPEALRLPLAPLSPAAVARLADSFGRPAGGLHEACGGNPFYLTELLQSPPGEGLPASVREAVLARWRSLPAAARELLDWACISPTGLDADLLRHLSPHDPVARQQAVGSGLAREASGSLRIAHELARSALQEALGARAAALHAALFDALDGRPELLSRRVHHAAAAGLGGAVLKLAPEAAAHAAATGAHRQAVQLYALALAQATSPTARLGLLDAQADALLLTNQLDAARAASDQALTLARRLGRLDGATHQTLRLARIAWLDGQPRDGLAHVAFAIDTLRASAPPGPPLAHALVLQARLHLRSHQLARALPGARQALQLFEQAGDHAGRAEALATLGAADLGGDRHDLALQQMRQALDLARAEGLEELAGRLHTNLAAAALVDGRLADLDAICAAGLAYCEAHDLQVHHSNLQLRQACGALVAGQWRPAERQLARLLAGEALNSLQRRLALQLQALQAVRRDAAGAQAAWQAALDKADPQDPPWFICTELQAIEAAALRDDTAGALAWLERAEAQALRRHERWCHAELQIWRQRLGGQALLRADAPQPFALEAAGDHAGAARAWAKLGMPYAQGLALLSGGAAELREALALLQPLGATLAARCARRRLRAMGMASAAGLPRGPYRHRRGDSLGLTQRERQVLDGLREGLSNRALAERLHRSLRTVEHHVAALMAKLGASNRAEAARLARLAEAKLEN